MLRRLPHTSGRMSISFKGAVAQISVLVTVLEILIYDSLTKYFTWNNFTDFKDHQ